MKFLETGKVPQAVESISKALRIYEQDEEKYIDKLLECCWLSCIVSETAGDTKSVKNCLSICFVKQH